MKLSKEVVSVYSAGLIQGVALVAFPAVSTILTSPHYFNFTGTDYGLLFIPQSATAIAASFLSSRLNRNIGAKSVFILGLIANLISMALLAASPLGMEDKSLAFALLMTATGFLGLGFGLTVPSVNLIAPLFNPGKVDAMILVLNALLGVGTALSPVFVALFAGLGFWWGLPLMLSILLVALLAFTLPLNLPGGRIVTVGTASAAVVIPHKFWIFALFALLYGIIETLNGNWITLFMKEHEGATVSIQSLALCSFWGTVTLGRVFFALIERWLPQAYTFRILPFIAAAAFLILFSMPSRHPYIAIAAFSLAGFACSALLPLVISFGQAQLSEVTTFATGGIIAFYLAGYGIAAFGAGGLQELMGIPLNEVFGVGAFIALFLGIVAIKISENQRIKAS